MACYWEFISRDEPKVGITISRSLALDQHPDSGQWQLPGNFSLFNKHTYRSIAKCIFSFFLSLSLSLSLSLCHNIPSPSLNSWCLQHLFYFLNIFAMEIWSYAMGENRSLCYFILILNHSTSSWGPRESSLV